MKKSARKKSRKSRAIPAVEAPAPESALATAMVAARVILDARMLDARRHLDGLMLAYEEGRPNDARRHFVAALRSMAIAEERMLAVLTMAYRRLPERPQRSVE